MFFYVTTYGLTHYRDVTIARTVVLRMRGIVKGGT